jgi:pyridoxine 5-phosphate synthase
VHLREDRRHISDDDLVRLHKALTAPINLEMAATQEMLGIALATKPHAICLVPEKRTEVTTEGGLDVAAQQAMLAPYIAQLVAAGMRVSLFVDPNQHQLEAAKAVGAAVVELHTGAYAHASGGAQKAELERLQNGAQIATALGLECHAGHGLTYNNVGAVAAITDVVELNIGHFLMGEALFVGLPAAIRTMRALMERGRGA